MFDMAASQRYPEMSTAWDKMKHLMQADLPKNATVEAGSWCELAHAGATLCDQMWPVDSLYEVLTGATWCRLSKEPWETQWQREMEKDGELGCAMRCDAMRHAGSCPACHPMCGDVAAFGFWDHKTILRHSCDCASSSMLTGCLWWFSDDLCAYIYLYFTYWSIACREDAKRWCLMSLQCCHSRHWFLCLVSANAPEGWSPKKNLHEYCTSFMLGRDRSLKTLTSIATWNW